MTAIPEQSPPRPRVLVVASVVPLLALGVIVTAVLTLLLSLIGLVIGVVLTAVAVAVYARSLTRGVGARVLTQLGAVPVDPADHARLLNLAEGLSVTSGVPVPDLMVVDDPAANLLVVGDEHGTPAVVFTQGLLGALDRVQLEGVVARAFAQLRQGDLAAATVAVTAVGRPAAALDAGGPGAVLVRPFAGLVERGLRLRLGRGQRSAPRSGGGGSHPLPARTPGRHRGDGADRNDHPATGPRHRPSVDGRPRRTRSRFSSPPQPRPAGRGPEAAVRRVRRTGSTLLVLAALLFVGACSKSSASAPDTTVAPAVTTTTEPPAPLPTYPLTGLPDAAVAEAQHPAIVVKIDNGIKSRPQTGLNQADVVFEEEVEGVTRLAATFHSTLPDVVGNVRSARSSDIDLVAQLSTPLFAWSGGNPGVTKEVATAASEGVLTNASADLAYDAYYRSSERRQPYDLYVHPRQLLDLRAPEGQGPPAPVFAYRVEDSPVPPGTLPVAGVSIPFTRYAQVTYAWDPARQGWGRFQVDSEHGPEASAFVDSDGVLIAPQNVVVLMTPYGASPSDSRSPKALTVGEGDAQVFIGGTVVTGRWIRPDRSQPVQLVASDGSPILLAPGRTWVELPRTTVPVTYIDQPTADGLLAQVP